MSRPKPNAKSAVLTVLLSVPLLLGLTFTLQTSTVTYSASDSRSGWQGVAPLENVTLNPGPGGLRVEAVLEPGRFNSGNFARDGNARFTVFETGRYPTATLSGTLPLAAATTGPEGVPRAQQAPFTGQLTLHGVTREVTFAVTVVREGDEVSAEGAFAVRLSDYGMTRPSLFGTTVDDRVGVNVSLAGVLE